MPEEVFKIISFLSVFQILIFIIFISKSKSIKYSSKFYLILFLVSILFCLTDRLQFYYRRELYIYKFPHFYNLIDFFGLVYLPSFFYYLLSITREKFRLRWSQSLHFLPAIIVFANLLFKYYLQPTEIKFELLEENAPFGFEIWEINIPALFNGLQTIYLVVGLWIIFKYEQKLKANLANIDFTLISLLKVTFTIILIVRIGRIVEYLIYHKLIFPIDFDLAIFAILITVIGYLQSKSILQPDFISDIKQIKPTSPFPEEQLYKIVIEKKSYLNPNISLKELADQIGVSDRELSQYLNNRLNLNFFNYINNLRIEEAKEQLQAPGNNGKTILEILYEVGYNNKSAFNREFKRITGQTPSEYRKQNLK